MDVQVTHQDMSASFSRFSHSGVVQISLAWAETDQGRLRMIAAYRATEAGVCRKCA